MHTLTEPQDRDLCGALDTLAAILGGWTPAAVAAAVDVIGMWGLVQVDVANHPAFYGELETGYPPAEAEGRVCPVCGYDLAETCETLWAADTPELVTPDGATISELLGGRA